ncbi:MAG: TetR family transcriptional regulator [Lacisediminihabitans sp.]
MVRWEAGTRERLIHAAFELFEEQGFAETSVPEIAARVGVTSRTFFRYFGDKREVLFGNEDLMAEQLRAGLSEAPPGLSTDEFIVWALGGIAREGFTGNRDEMRRLRALVESDEHLRERALSKRLVLYGPFSDALVCRGLSPMQARLLAETTIAALQVAADEWLLREDSVSVDVLALDAIGALEQYLPKLSINAPAAVDVDVDEIAK